MQVEKSQVASVDKSQSVVLQEKTLSIEKNEDHVLFKPGLTPRVLQRTQRSFPGETFKRFFYCCLGPTHENITKAHKQSFEGKQLNF